MGASESCISRGKLAKATGVNGETIRYYEAVDLLPEPKRSRGGHRLYTDADLRRLRFIRRARELGFSLDEIKGLLSLVDEQRLTCAEVLARTVDHLDDVRARISDLKKMERTLKKMAALCEGDNRPECQIIETLFA